MLLLNAVLSSTAYASTPTHARAAPSEATAYVVRGPCPISATRVVLNVLYPCRTE
jgi:hypothetical protein